MKGEEEEEKLAVAEGRKALQLAASFVESQLESTAVDKQSL